MVMVWEWCCLSWRRHQHTTIRDDPNTMKQGSLLFISISPYLSSTYHPSFVFSEVLRKSTLSYWYLSLTYVQCFLDLILHTVMFLQPYLKASCMKSVVNTGSNMFALSWCIYTILVTRLTGLEVFFVFISKDVYPPSCMGIVLWLFPANLIGTSKSCFLVHSPAPCNFSADACSHTHVAYDSKMRHRWLNKTTRCCFKNVRWNILHAVLFC